MIFLHGLGGSAESYLHLFGEKELVPKNCRIVLPTASSKPVTCEDGKLMNSWFDKYKPKPKEMYKRERPKINPYMTVEYEDGVANVTEVGPPPEWRMDKFDKEPAHMNDKFIYEKWTTI